MNLRCIFFAVAFALLLSGCAGSYKASDSAYWEAENTLSTETVRPTGAAVIPDDASATERYCTEENATEELVDYGESGFHYFFFPQYESHHKAADGTLLLQEHLVLPEFYSGEAMLAEWVNGILQKICNDADAASRQLLKFAEEAKQSDREEAFYAYSNYLSIGVGRHDDRFISLMALNTTYSGAEPSSMQKSYNLDLKYRRVLKLEDLFSREDQDRLTDLVIGSMEGSFLKLNEQALHDAFLTVIRDSLRYGDMTPNWYFNDKGLVIYFNPYQLGSYNFGIMKAQITYEQMGGLLKQDFFPVSPDTYATDVQITQTMQSSDYVYSIRFGEGETRYVSPVGTASCVQLSEVYLAGNTPVDESMLFSANCVKEDVTFEVTGNLTDPDAVYALQYWDADGGPKHLFICGGELYSELPLK